LIAEPQDSIPKGCHVTVVGLASDDTYLRIWLGLSVGQQEKATKSTQPSNKHHCNFAVDCGLQKFSSLAVNG
jgi:hypothetical protein